MTIQAAVDALPENGIGTVPIRVKAGVYHEKLHMEKPGIHLIGEGAGADDHYV
ncbi:pectinesterase family protein [Paenibacillus amylolyticus]|nr:pectinesterase family protein [Paenibacillus amylolyticus]